jgi:anaerobic sulfite reductase subunit B
MVPVRHRVVARRQELPDTVTLDLEPLDRSLRPAQPGQFNMLWAFGSGEVPISVSGAPTERQPLQHTIRAVGAATSALCRVQDDDVIGVRGPFGSTWELERAKGGDLVVIAGGIGLAPLRPVVLGVLADRHAFGEVAVVVGARSPDALLYLDEIGAWRAGGDLDVQVTVDHAGQDWSGDVGVVTDLLDHVRFDPSHTTALVCGPEIMMRFATAALLDRGLPSSSIRLSLERNMKCAVAHCGRCQLGPTLVCREGPVYTDEVVGTLLSVRGR